MQRGFWLSRTKLIDSGLSTIQGPVLHSSSNQDANCGFLGIARPSSIERRQNHITFTRFRKRVLSSHRSCRADLPASRIRAGALRIDRCGIPDAACRRGVAPVPGTHRRIYLDFNASIHTAPEVVDAMRRVIEEPYGNPSSGHWAGSPAREAVDKARMQVAGLLGCKTNEIVFTSGGSEANNHALKGVFFAGGRADAHIVTTHVGLKSTRGEATLPAPTDHRKAAATRSGEPQVGFVLKGAILDWRACRMSPELTLGTASPSLAVSSTSAT